MNLARMTEIYQHGGRERLVAAVEDFSVTTKAEMMSDIDLAPRKRPLEKTARDAVDGHAGYEACSY